MIKLIFFDVDGTLVDSEEVILRSFDYAFKENLPERRLPLKEYSQFLGPVLYDTFSRFTKDEDKINTMVTDFIQYYRIIEPKLISLYPKVDETLKKLKDDGYILLVLTNKYKTSVLPSLNYLNIIGYFDDIYAFGMAERPKPYPDLINMALERYNIKGDEALMVGDNTVDVYSARNANIKCALVSYNEWSEEAKKETNPDYYIDNISEIINIVKEIK